MLQEKIDRINFLSRKSKTVGLTDAEKQEQQKLRQEYIAEWRLGMNQVLDNTYIMDEKGNKKKLTPKNQLQPFCALVVKFVDTWCILAKNVKLF